MANTYTQLLIYIQIVFAVKARYSLISEDFREVLQKYIVGIILKKKQKLYAIYCMPDHVHLLISISPDIAISDLVGAIKSNSTSFINEKKLVNGHFEWQRGLGAFSYRESQVDTVIKYILQQPARHKTKTFKEEYIEFLEKFNIDFDNKYIFDFWRIIKNAFKV